MSPNVLDGNPIHALGRPEILGDVAVVAGPPGQAHELVTDNRFAPYPYESLKTLECGIEPLMLSTEPKSIQAGKGNP